MSRPRREWWSCLCSRRCSVRWLMRRVSSAICTSGEPVSSAVLPNCCTTSRFWSVVSVIGGGPEQRQTRAADQKRTGEDTSELPSPPPLLCRLLLLKKKKKQQKLHTPHSHHVPDRMR